MNVVVKCFVTPFGYYVFDRSTNRIIKVDEKEYRLFTDLENGIEDESIVQMLRNYQKQGLCKENELERIEHPDAPTLKYHLEHRMQKLTLQITQNCNLRCSYCAYSGKYNQRTHNQNSMSVETLQKSIDFVMKRSDGVERLNIGFYGGEPLLEFQKIRKAIGYIKEKYAGRKVDYSITTNGTIVNDEILTFFIENDFNIMISLDGPKEMHNRNRVFENGVGSFDKVMDNLRYVKEHYPEFFKKISFNTVVAPGNDYKCINDFFSANEVLDDNNLSRSTVSTWNIKDAISYDDKYFITYKYQSLKVLMAALGLYSKDKISRLFATDFVEIQRFYDSIGKIQTCTKCAHPGGPCIPGARRPMVDIHGNIFPCERVSEKSDIMKIGHIDFGFDVDKAYSVLNIGQLTEKECLKCWNFAHCGLCASAADAGGVWSKEKKLSYCENSKRGTLDTMRSVCLLKENNYDFGEDFFNE